MLNNAQGHRQRGSSYADVTRNPGKHHANVNFSMKSYQQLIFDVGKEDMKRFEKAFV